MIRVETQVLDVERFAEHLPMAGVPFEVGERIAEIEGLPKASTRRVRVRASGPAGVLAEREIVIRHVRDLAITVVMTRDCRNVDCPDGRSCLGGRCVDPECLTGEEPECPDPICELASECPAMDMCSAPICASGLCVYIDAGRCPARTYCSPEDGCLPLPEDDAGLPDAGIDGSTLAPPTPFAPLNGELTGRGDDTIAEPGLRPRFRWRGVAESFRLVVDDSCPLDGWQTCTFPSPEIDVTVPALEHRPADALPVSTSAPVGRRYYWRVRGCGGRECGEWSETRYLDVGRLGHDVDGDGFDDLLIGYRYGMEVRRSNGAAFLPPQDIANPFADATSDYGIAIATGDIDANGFSDVVVGAGADRGFGSIAIHLGGAGPLAGPSQTIESPFGINSYFGDEVCMGDFDGDGHADVGVSARSPNELYVYFGGPAGLDGREAGPLPGRIRGCGDIDGDGYADVVSSQQVLLGSASGLTADTARIGFRNHSIAGDLDDDGDLDLASFGNDTTTNVVLLDGASGGSTSYSAGNGSFDLERVLGPGDFDGDGLDDVVLGWQGASAGDDGNAFVLPADTFVLQTLSIACSGCRINAARLWGVDFDGDGYGDVAIGSESGQRIDVFYGAAAGLSTTPGATFTGGDAYGQAL